MRGKRSKQYRKLMHQYGLTFGFREPYQVLLSSTIIQDAARCKMRLGSMLEHTVHGTIKPMITQCCIRQLYTSTAPQAEKDEWIAVAKQAERRRCGHHELEEPLSELECMKSVIDPKESGTNKHRYVVATQDTTVRQYLRSQVAGVPLIYVARSVMILEPMGGKTELARERDEKEKIRAGLKTRRGGDSTAEKRKREEDDDDAAGDAADTSATPKKKKARGPKGPNPLSVKKAKKPDPSTKPAQNGEKSAQQPAKLENVTTGENANGGGSGDEGAGDVLEGTRKRKRKRKPKDANEKEARRHADDGEEED